MNFSNILTHSRYRCSEVMKGTFFAVFLMRFQAFKADAVVRITADCPCLEGVYVDGIVSQFTTGDFDYVSNIVNIS